jgi:AmmeMemoRadiSam system protein B
LFTGTARFFVWQVRIIAAAASEKLLIMQHIRPPAVAGSFYPASADELRRDVEAFLAGVQPAAKVEATPKILIAPHAGYIYSGAIAASAYARIAAAANLIERVVLLGPAHRVHVDGMALPAATHFETPLGIIAIDQDAVAAVSKLPQVVISDRAHAQEHSLEVHLPFLQRVLGTFKLVPFAVGNASPQQVAQVLDQLWGGNETLIVISSDLSHYLPYPRACATDEFTAETILRLQPQLDHRQACGATPINGVLMAARARGLEPSLLDLRNSGDTAGDKSRVVGYASFAFHERTS